MSSHTHVDILPLYECTGLCFVLSVSSMKRTVDSTEAYITSILEHMCLINRRSGGPEGPGPPKFTGFTLVRHVPPPRKNIYTIHN